MPSKKKEVIPEKKVVKKPVTVKPSDIIEVYEGVFPEYIVYTQVKYDFNWIGIRRLIQSFNIFKYLNSWLKKKEGDNTKYLSDNSVTPITKINWKFHLNNFWFNYCKWFDSIFNKKVE